VISLSFVARSKRLTSSSTELSPGVAGIHCSLNRMSR
jgi:hypothetical protein